MKTESAVSTAAIIGGLTAIMLMVLAAVLLIPHGDESSQRLGAFMGIAAIVVTALVALLKADQAATSSAKAATQTNGSLDARITAAVLAANYTRRSADLPGGSVNDNAAPPVAPPPSVMGGAADPATAP